MISFNIGHHDLHIVGLRSTKLRALPILRMSFVVAMHKMHSHSSRKERFKGKESNNCKCLMRLIPHLSGSVGKPFLRFEVSRVSHVV